MFTTNVCWWFPYLLDLVIEWSTISLVGVRINSGTNFFPSSTSHPARLRWVELFCEDRRYVEGRNLQVSTLLVSPRCPGYGTRSCISKALKWIESSWIWNNYLEHIYHALCSLGLSISSLWLPLRIEESLVPSRRGPNLNFGICSPLWEKVSES